ncbi:ankyrin repeat-containing domain protein [Xylaria arbuscula]|nr:ankyrin repeat-containing domain protein [Xylaria arbuscula]
MSPALQLPLELIHWISTYLEDAADLSSWSRSCRAFRAVITPLLYRLVKDDLKVIFWASSVGPGANANALWIQREPRWWTLQGLCKADVDARAWSSPAPLARELEMKRHIREKSFMGRSDAARWLMKLTGLDETVLTVARYFEDNFRMNDLVDGARAVQHYLRPPWGSDDTDTRTWSCYWTPLHVAAALGDDELVTLLLDNGADINSLSRLFCSCLMPPKDDVAPLWTALHSSICYKQDSTTKLLLSRGASTNITQRYLGIDGTEENQFTALHSACLLQNLDIARVLVEGGYQPDVTICDRQKLTPLAYAVFRGDWTIIHFLLEHGGNINAKIGPVEILGYACLMGYYLEALRFLDVGAIPQRHSDSYDPPPYFHLTAVAGAPSNIASYRAQKQKEFRLPLANRLIKQGVDINEMSINGTTALAAAANLCRSDIVEALLRSGAHVFHYEYALQKAVSLGPEQSKEAPKGAMLSTVRILLKAMVETLDLLSVSRFVECYNSVTYHDLAVVNTLQLICRQSSQHKDKLEVLALLLTYKRAVQIANDKHLVYESLVLRDFDITNVLLENGVNPPSEQQFQDVIETFVCFEIVEGLSYILNRFPDMAHLIRNDQLLWRAVYNHWNKSAKLLIEEGVSIHSQNEAGSSMLYVASIGRDKTIVELLLKNGADPDECTEGVALATLVAWNRNIGDIPIIQLLLDYGASIHSPPPGKPTLLSDMGFLDIVITAKLINTVKQIVRHQSCGSPTDEEASSHWRAIMSHPNHVNGLARKTPMIDTILSSGKFNVNQIFPITVDERGSAELSTPLHLCIATHAGGGSEDIEKLITYKADAHMVVAVQPNCQVHTLQPQDSKRRRFEGTTPLEWAIKFSTVSVVRALVRDLHRDLGCNAPLNARFEERKKDMMLRYGKAACQCEKPKMVALLFSRGLDPATRDEKGNTMAHMICDYAEKLSPNDYPAWRMASVAQSAAHSVVACLVWGVDFYKKNMVGVSGIDRVLGIRKYTGSCEYRRELAGYFRDYIDYVEGSVQEIRTKVHPPDIADPSFDSGVLYYDLSFDIEDVD